MDGSSSEELYDEATWVFYKDRLEWKDIKPVAQDDGPYPVVAISYSEKFADVYDYFRAVLQKNELSERALDLTRDAVNLNPANYTVWQYRRDILKYLNKDLREELKFVKEIIEDNPKGYQVWHHRRVIVEWLNDPSEELKLTADILAIDAKNYHAWQYRQWVITSYKLFDNELNYVNELLADDIRNNSAWNQRYFVLNRTGFTPEIVKREIDFTLEKIKSATINESSWNYLRGVLLHSQEGLREPIVMKFCEDLYETGNRSPYLLALLIDMAEEEVENSTGNIDTKSLPKAIQLCYDLAEKYDKIRCQYWKFIAETLKSYQPSTNLE